MNFLTSQSARSYLVAHGYVDAHVPPGSPQLWVRPNDKVDRRGIARTDAGFEIVPYPLDKDELSWMD
jgi:hypothetical protein